MKIINDVFDLAMDVYRYGHKMVYIDDENIDYLVETMRESGKTEFPSLLINNSDSDTILTELIASSINYCYFYGASSIKPANSSKMYDIVRDVMFVLSDESVEKRINIIKNLITLARFPLLEERIKHLDELIPKAEKFCSELHYGVKFSRSFNTLIMRFPGFGSDMFLKRAFLFFIQLNRSLGWFEDAMYQIPVPADYQLPKMLYYYGCIKYDMSLLNKIQTSQLIPKHSLEECKIRAATILACEMIRERLGWNAEEVDSWLWCRRKEADHLNFHLTETTDY